MIIFLKSHPATQAMSRAAAPADLNEPGLRRNPGEPSAEQAESDAYNKPRIQWRGLTIAIENPAGSVRRGRNRHGVTWEVRMRFDYGEVVGSMGVDGDPVDIYMGPNPDAPMVYVVHQRRVNDWTEYDEDKCMVGFDSQADAEAAFLSNYNDPRFLGPITAMPVDEFVQKVRATAKNPAMIKSVPVMFLKTHVNTYTRKDGTVVAAHEDRRGSAHAQQKKPEHVTETEAFKKWFSNSKVIDADGKPLVVYHGTRSDFNVVDTAKAERLPGFWVTPDAKLASTYAAEGVVNATSYRAGANVMPLYVKIEKPYQFNPKKESFGSAWDKYQEGDFDGFIETGNDAKGVMTINVKNPTQIKSATGNNGDFDPKSPVITKSHTPVVLFFKSHVGPYLRGGKIVNVAGYQGKGARAMPQPGQMSLFGGPESGKPLPPTPLKGKDPVERTPDMFSEHPPEKVAWAKKVISNRDYMPWQDVKEAHNVLGIKDDDAEWASKKMASAKKNDTVTEPRADLIAEHERLVGVLESPSHADDQVEAKRQAKELAEMKGEDNDPEAELRSMWTKQGVSKERQDQLLGQIGEKSAPGAKVGPFTVGDNATQKPVVFLKQPDQSSSNLSNNRPVETKQEMNMDENLERAKRLAGPGFEDIPDAEIVGTLAAAERVMGRPFKDSEASYFRGALDGRRKTLAERVTGRPKFEAGMYGAPKGHAASEDRAYRAQHHLEANE
jgi:hypothetical protein